MLYIVLFLAFFISKNAFAEQPEVKIDQGILKGVFMETVSHRKISAFLGVPYAKPPIGNLRFREPQIPSNWLGVWNATSLPPDCLQYAPINEPIHGSEDCLYLSIFVPEEPKDHKNLLNVLVNIHGGGFMYYSSSNYGPEYLLDKDVILVNVNYRLGVLGFMSTGDLEVPGNNGLKDQNLALRWVQKNIRRFGGNPEKVTLTGLSAGGASTQFHMISPKSKGLVQRAIVASGSVLCNWVQTENAKEKAVALAHHLGCETSDVKKMVECLRKRPGEHLVASTKLFMVWLYYPFSPFGTVVEPSHPNAFIDHPPSFYLKNGHFNDIPVLFSLTADEGLFPGLELMADDAKLKFLDQNWISLSPHVLDYNFTSAVEHHEKISSEILKEYFGSGSIKDQKNILIELMGDRFFNTAVSKAAKLQAAKSKSPVYAFVFSHVVKKGIQGFSNLSREIYPGTAHGDDVHHVLKLTSNSADVLEKSMTERMVNLYFDFMEGEKFPENWEQVKDNLPAFSYMNIASEDVSADRFVIEKDFGRENFWTGINLLEDGMSKDFHDEL